MERKTKETAVTIKTKYEFGEVVYIKNDEDQTEFIVVGIIARPGALLLEVSYLGDVSEVYEFEVSKTLNKLKKLGADPADNEEDG